MNGEKDRVAGPQDTTTGMSVAIRVTQLRGTFTFSGAELAIRAEQGVARLPFVMLY